MQALRSAIQALDELSRDIIKTRWLQESDNEFSLKRPGRKHGISK